MTNIALVVLDTLRKDYFDEHFDWLSGTRYENAWSTSHWTVPAHASLFAGKYASELGVYAGAQKLDCSEPVLAEQLNQSGYQTRAFSSNVNISPAFDFHRGFKEFEGSWRLNSLEKNVFNWDEFIVNTRGEGPERYIKAFWKCIASDCETVPSLKRGAMLKLRDLGLDQKQMDDGAKEALDYVRNTSFDDREFLFMNLMEAHTPYNPPSEYQTVKPPELNGLRATLSDGPRDNPDRIRQAYDDSVRYLSDIYKEIYQELYSEFDYIITLGDHGEVLGEHDAWEHLCGIYPELTHVPLVVSGSEVETEERSDLVSLLDVYETVLKLANIESMDSRGHSLLKPHDTSKSVRYLSEYHGLTPRHETALSNEGVENDVIEEYNQKLFSIIDGGLCAYQLSNGEFEQVGDSKLPNPKQCLDEMKRDLDYRTSSTDGDVSEAVKRQLEELGYA